MNTPSRKVRLRQYIGAVLLVVVVGLVTSGGLYLLWQPSALTASAETHNVTIDAGVSHPLAWPDYGQAVVATKDYGVLVHHGDTEPQATASTAKLITALAIMKQRPFDDGKGATITFSQADVDSYNQYVAGNGTTTAVTVGLELTQYQALEAVLLDSANNVSDTLAVWAFGSLESYREAAQEMVASLGMTSTTIGVDASGYSATTTSTAHDLALLAIAVLQDPMLRRIVSQSRAELPGVGVIENSNKLLVDSEVLGMKTGWIPEAGGVFVFAGRQNIRGASHEIITVVMGAPGGASRTAQDAAYELYQSAKQNFRYQVVLSQGQTVGSYQPSWQEDALSLQVAQELQMFVWGGLAPDVAIEAANVVPGQHHGAGKATVTVGQRSAQVPLSLDRPADELSWWEQAQARLSL